MNSSSDETYLEAFIDQLSTLPYQLRRNLDLLRDLDSSCSADLWELRTLHRQYIHAAEEKMMQLEVVAIEDVDQNETEEDCVMNTDDDDDDDNNNGADNRDLWPKKKNKAANPQYGVRVLNADGSTSPDNPVVVPTTQEFINYISSDNDVNCYPRIRALQHDCLQKADEKVAVVHQTYSLLEAQVQRLDADLIAMEQLLQVCFYYG